MGKNTPLLGNNSPFGRLPNLQTERFWSVLPDRPKTEASNSKPSTSGTVTQQGASSVHQLPKLLPRLVTPCAVRVSASLPKEPSNPSTFGDSDTAGEKF